jgi:hypothetical protein
MQSSAWAQLFGHIPPGEQNHLMLVTASGIEIAMQCILRVDPECVAIKGRLAGSQDAGRVFFIPFDHIDYLGFQQEVKESHFHELFGSLTLPAAPAAVPPAASTQEPTAEAAPDPIESEPDSLPGIPGEPSGAGAPVAPSLTGRTTTPIKSAVLERFRQRSLTQAGTLLRPPLDG